MPDRELAGGELTVDEHGFVWGTALIDGELRQIPCGREAEVLAAADKPKEWPDIVRLLAACGVKPEQVRDAAPPVIVVPRAKPTLRKKRKERDHGK